MVPRVWNFRLFLWLIWFRIIFRPDSATMLLKYQISSSGKLYQQVIGTCKKKDAYFMSAQLVPKIFFIFVGRAMLAAGELKKFHHLFWKLWINPKLMRPYQDFRPLKKLKNLLQHHYGLTSQCCLMLMF